MNPLLRWSGLFVFALLAGCAATGDTSGLSGAGTQGSSMDTDNTLPMCAQHREIMSARTPQERQALMEEYMKGMTPAMRDQRLATMHERCQSE
jgi:hypothetical protein